MPEVSVDENSQLMAWKYQVRSAREALDVLAKSQAATVQFTANQTF